MAGCEAPAMSQNNDGDALEMAAAHDTSESTASADRPQRGQLLPARASTVQVLRELDQLLTMDTLIYFAQAVVELFWLSFHFAYAQEIKPPTPPVLLVPPAPLALPAPPQPTPRKTDRASRRQLIWKKPKRSAYKPPRQESTSLAGAQSNQIDIYPDEINSDTGPAAPSHPTGPPRVPALSKLEARPALVFDLPPPPLVVCTPKIQPTAPLSLATTTDSTSALGPTQTPSPQIVSHQSQTSPRRKPVPSRARRSSSKFDRGTTHPSPIPRLQITDTNSQQQAAQRHVSNTVQPAPAVVIVVKPVSPPLVRKSSAKFVRPPVASETDKPSLPNPLPSQLPPSSPSQFPPSPPPPTPPPTTQGPPLEESTALLGLSQQDPNPLARKSSAKFFRPPTQSSGVSHVEPTPVADPTPEPHSPPQSLVQPPAESHPQPEESPEGLEPQPQRLISYSKLTSFPPRPAIAIVQAAPSLERSPSLPEQAPLPEEEPVLPPIPSFPELPAIIPSNPRLPPPPPAIPRFPSPTKATEQVISAPVSTITTKSEPQPSQPKIPKRRPVSMAAIASPSEVLPETDQGWIVRPETASNFTSTSLGAPALRPDWDPSQDDNIFSATTQTAPKQAVSSAPTRQFSSHGSITSHSSSDSPPRNSSTEPVPSPKGTVDKRNHVRAVSNHSHHVPSPIPSPRARPRSAGSISSGSDYILPAFTFDNTHLKPGNAAALLSHAETLNMYRQNARKAVDNPATQYEFAIFMMDAARDAAMDASTTTKPGQIKDLLKEGLSILRRLADRGYPQAQYYLADCYTNGIGCKQNAPDLEKAFPLFVLAAKHGHVEASFRAALAYENAWGCRRDPLKALQFLKKAASANHPGAMLRLGKACLNAEFGMPSNQAVTLEGVNWLKRAAEAATPLYPNAPYELALLHEFGYKDVVFPDEAYALQLFSRASDLGNAEASYRLGEAYEYGRLGLPEDPSLSIHYYSLAARLGNAPAMLSLCAWYMVGAEGVLEKSDEEAFAWAHRAAEAGLAKAEFATGYFLERGVGCRRDGLEAWKYYVKAAEHGDERAVARLKAGKEVNADRGLVASSAAAESERRSNSDGESKDDSGSSAARAMKFWKR